MKKFKVTITETLEEEVEVEAESAEEAEQKVMDEYYRCDRILDSDNFVGTEFSTEELPEKKLNREREER